MTAATATTMLLRPQMATLSIRNNAEREVAVAHMWATLVVGYSRLNDGAVYLAMGLERKHRPRPEGGTTIEPKGCP